MFGFGGPYSRPVAGPLPQGTPIQGMPMQRPVNATPIQAPQMAVPRPMMQANPMPVGQPQMAQQLTQALSMRPQTF